jgi:hypothetical protein
VLDRLREDEAIEVAGGAGAGNGDGGADDEPRQVVFDLGSGDLRAADGPDDGDAVDPTPDPDAAAVLDELRGVAVDEIAPVDLATRVREWQRTLDEGEGEDEDEGNPRREPTG